MTPILMLWLVTCLQPFRRWVFPKRRLMKLWQLPQVHGMMCSEDKDCLFLGEETGQVLQARWQPNQRSLNLPHHPHSYNTGGRLHWPFAAEFALEQPTKPHHIFQQQGRSDYVQSSGTTAVTSISILALFSSKAATSSTDMTG